MRSLVLSPLETICGCEPLTAVALGCGQAERPPRSGNLRDASNSKFSLCRTSRADVSLDQTPSGQRKRSWGGGVCVSGGVVLLSTQRSRFDHPGKAVSGVRMALSRGPMASPPSWTVTGPGGQDGWSCGGEGRGQACGWIKVKQEEKLTPHSCCSSNVLFPALCKPGLTRRQQKMSNN